MFHKFALAFKTKTIELFADDDGGAVPEEAVITGQRVVVIKPDQPPGHIKLHKLQAMVGALFAAATAASFKAANHLLQAAHAPPKAAAAKSVDRATVSHLARLSDLKRAHLEKLPVALPSQLEAEVQENQSLLRTFDMAVNWLQSEIDGKEPGKAGKQQRCDSSKRTCF